MKTASLAIIVLPCLTQFLSLDTTEELYCYSTCAQSDTLTVLFQFLKFYLIFYLENNLVLQFSLIMITNFYRRTQVKKIQYKQNTLLLTMNA